MRKKVAVKSKKSPPVKVRRSVKKSKRAPKVVRSPEWLAQEQKLKAEALTLLLKSRVILAVVTAVCDTIDQMIILKDSGKLSWMEQEKWYEDVERINAKIVEVDKALGQLDKAYEDVRKRVNAFYGEEVMSYRPPHQKVSEALEEEDKADWWKKTEDTE